MFWELEPSGVLDITYGDQGISSQVFVYDPSSPRNQLYSPGSDIPPMIGAKANPKIATIGGKLYVLGCKPHCRVQNIPSPAFECYYPSSSEWVELPEPPHYRHKKVYHRMGACWLRAFFVMGRNIYIHNCFGVSFYNVDVGEWKDATYILGENEHNSASLPFYNRLAETTSIAEGEDGVVIAYTRGGLKAYFYGVDGAFQFEQRLSQIDDNIGNSEYNRGFVYFLGEGKFCFVLSARKVKNILWAVRIAIFLVDVQGDAFLDAVVLHSHDYDFSHFVPNYNFLDIENVLIVRGGEVKLEDPLLVAVYGQWLTPLVTGPRPSPRSKHAAAIIEDQMYVLGGCQGGIYLNDVQSLDMRSWTWSKVEVKASGEALESASPVRVAPCARHSLIPWGAKKLLLIAGLTKDPSEAIEVKQFDLQSAAWSTLKTHGKPPVSRGGQSVTLVGTRLVVFGGEDAKGSLLNDLHILDLETLTWGEIDTSGLPPFPRSDHAAAVHADHCLFIFGGSSHTACFNDLHVLDLQTMEWSRPAQKGEIPSPRAGHAGVTIGESWFIAGGGDKNSGVSDTIVLNMSTLAWSVVTTVQRSGPLASEGLSLVLGSYRGQHMLVSFGGYKYNGRYSNEVNVLKPSYQIETLQPTVVTEGAAFPAAAAALSSIEASQGDGSRDHTSRSSLA
ncbi:hypothetical protein LguiB_006734 [Lonicera macranthoides]